jgi:hypothetical protein
MRYLKVEWKHDEPGEPTLLYSEVDDDGWEVRKVELFRDGKMGHASRQADTELTMLGEVAVPSLEAIADDPEFVPSLISKEEFEGIWHKALSSKWQT